MVKRNVIPLRSFATVCSVSRLRMKLRPSGIDKVMPVPSMLLFIGNVSGEIIARYR